jgi:hypothetical protein
MSLKSAIDDFLANPPVQSGFPCKIDRIITDLPKEDGKALADLIDNDKISSSAISRLLMSHNFDVKSASIIKHRKRGEANGCRCKK